MNRKEWFRQCRYYKGEEKCPRAVEEKGKGLYWSYEKQWAESESARDENNGNVMEYIRYGLKDFNADDGTPITIKAILFNRYCHWSGNYNNQAEGFKEWYKSYYKGGAN